jgi:23S rRNA (cytidine1920-2'-O)/16S rRNA (cytidine1409-2'-O)-methyltransferase
VIALDVAHGQLDWGLRNDPRVHVIERANARELDPDRLPWTPSLATIDVSFISLRKVLPAVVGTFDPEGGLLALVKPQFELGRGRVGRGGVVRDPDARREAVLAVARWAAKSDLAVRGFAPSGLPGPKGNRETFVWLARDGVGVSDLASAVGEVEV